MPKTATKKAPAKKTSKAKAEGGKPKAAGKKAAAKMTEPADENGQASKADQLRQKHYEKIKAAEKSLDLIDAELNADRETYRATRTKHKKATAALRELIRSDPLQQKLPGMDDEPGGMQVGLASADTAGAPGADSVKLPDWRLLDLALLGLPDTLRAKMVEAEVDTLGKFADLTAEHGTHWFKRIKGIGEKAAEKLENLLADFWANHPEYTGGGEGRGASGEGKAAEPAASAPQRPSRVRLVKDCTGLHDSFAKGATLDVYEVDADGDLYVQDPDVAEERIMLEAEEFEVVAWETEAQK